MLNLVLISLFFKSFFKIIHNALVHGLHIIFSFSSFEYLDLERLPIQKIEVLPALKTPISVKKMVLNESNWNKKMTSSGKVVIGGFFQ